MRPIENPPNPFHEAHLEWDGPPPDARLELFEERCKSALSRNESPDLAFRWSLNPYRGCFHACSYCYARATHPYWDFGAGTDFDRKIVVKTNVVERLRETFERRSWRGEAILFSGNTDCYQPIEASYQLTRRCLELCAEYRNPVMLITKSKLVRRDIDLLARLTQEADCHVAISCAFSDDAMARKVEPYASPPSKRIETLKLLEAAGVPTTVALGPVIPGLNDDQIAEVLERAAEAGTRHASMILLRLSDPVLPVFDQRLEEAFPLRAAKVRSATRACRGGRGFGERMRGKGPRWEAIERLFDVHTRRLGLGVRETTIELAEGTFRRPSPQLALF